MNSRIRAPFYISFLNPVYVAARSLRSLRSNYLCEEKKLYFQDKSLCLSSNQDLILYEDDSNFSRATSKNTPFSEPADA